MSERAMPTLGPVVGLYADRATLEGDTNGSQSLVHVYSSHSEYAANRDLVVAAFNAATAAAAMGFDPIGAVQALPKLLEALLGYSECHDGCTCGDGWSHYHARAALAAARTREETP